MKDSSNEKASIKELSANLLEEFSTEFKQPMMDEVGVLYRSQKVLVLHLSSLF